MARWNVSGGDTLTLEERGRRSPSRWLRQNSLRIALVLGLIEAVFAWVTHHTLIMMLVGVLAVFGYLNVRHRLPNVIRRPLWVVVMAQAVAGLALPAVYAGAFVAMIIIVIMLVVMVLVMLGDRRR
jgi:hypothetical protein